MATELTSVDATDAKDIGDDILSDGISRTTFGQLLNECLLDRPSLSTQGANWSSILS